MKLKAITFVLLFILLFPVSAWANLSKTEVSQLYVSIFGRASEGEGNAYWQSQSEMVNAADSMLDTQAAKDYFGANLNTNQSFIEHIYLNTLKKYIADDFDGISYWVDMLNAGTTRGEAIVALVGAINDYAPDGPYYNPDDTATVAAYNQFMNRVAVSNYMADNVYAIPDDWKTSTSFSHGMVVTEDPATTYAAMVAVNGFTDEPVLPGPCGAYVAPGVWKEFDCYNLAAIGKTTNDDPFTPSWRLIGGYWQWGRKGPDPNQWYYMNTQHFAHGPTGPGEPAKSRAFYYILDQDADFFDTDIDGDGTVDLLANINSNGLRFTVDGGEELTIMFDESLLINGAIKNHADFVAALQGPLSQLVAQGKVPSDTVLTVDYTLIKSTFLDDGSRSSNIPAVILETRTSHVLESVGFNWVDDLRGEYNVYGRLDDNSDIADPCPAGFRVPSISQWQGVIDNNTQRTMGTWNGDDTNYSAARLFGDKLLLPTAGYRYYDSGALNYRGYGGFYWSGSEYGSSNAWYLSFGSGYADTYSSPHMYGRSVRCVSE